MISEDEINRHTDKMRELILSGEMEYLTEERKHDYFAFKFVFWPAATERWLPHKIVLEELEADKDFQNLSNEEKARLLAKADHTMVTALKWFKKEQAKLEEAMYKYASLIENR